jgi:hypothetical protein
VALLSFVGKKIHQSLAFSGFMVLSKQLGTRLNHDNVIDLQAVALERGQIYNFELDDRSKCIFNVGARLFPTFQLS